MPTHEATIPEAFRDRVTAGRVVHEEVRVRNPGRATGAAPAEETAVMSLHVDGTAVRVERHEACAGRALPAGAPRTDPTGTNG